MFDKRQVAPSVGSGSSLPNIRSVPDKSFFIFKEGNQKRVFVAFEGQWSEVNSSNTSQSSLGLKTVFVIKDISFTDVSLLLCNILSGDILESITIVTTTADSGITLFTIYDGIRYLVGLEDLDPSNNSVSEPARAMWREYFADTTLLMTITGGSTFTGKIIIKIVRNA